MQCANVRPCIKAVETQVFRHAGQGDFAQRALVVIGREAGQRQPARRQRRQLVPYRDRILEFFKRDAGFLRDLDNQAGDLAVGEINQDKLAHLRCCAFFMRPAVIEHAVERCIECNSKNAVRQCPTLYKSCGKLCGE